MHLMPCKLLNFVRQIEVLTSVDNHLVPGSLVRVRALQVNSGIDNNKWRTIAKKELKRFHWCGMFCF